jgi:hypothetical protein
MVFLDTVCPLWSTCGTRFVSGFTYPRKSPIYPTSISCFWLLSGCKLPDLITTLNILNILPIKTFTSYPYKIQTIVPATPRQRTVKPDKMDPKTPLRRVVWRSSMLMVAFYLLAVGLAIAHHLVYQHLDGKAVKGSQRWISRFATALAFAFKTALTISISLAFQEALWAAVRRRFFRIESLDKLFTVQSNPLSFFCWEGIVHGSAPLILAGIAWIVPIAVIFTPGALSIIPSTTHSYQLCSPPISIDNQYGVMWLGPCTTNGLSGATCAGEGTSTYSGLSLLLEKLVIQVVTGGILKDIATPPLPDTSNYSYTITFDGPALKCEEQPLSTTQISDNLYYNAYQVP